MSNFLNVQFEDLDRGLEWIASDCPPARWMLTTYALDEFPKRFQVGAQFGQLKATEIDSSLVTLRVVTEIR